MARTAPGPAKAPPVEGEHVEQRECAESAEEHRERRVEAGEDRDGSGQEARREDRADRQGLGHGAGCREGWRSEDSGPRIGLVLGSVFKVWSRRHGFAPQRLHTSAQVHTDPDVAVELSWSPTRARIGAREVRCECPTDAPCPSA